MEQEQIKIQYKDDKFTFFRIGESGAWQPFSERSDLRKIEMTEHVFSEDSIKRILDTIAEESGNATILFDGNEELYAILERIINTEYINQGIDFILRVSDDDGIEKELQEKLVLLLNYLLQIQIEMSVEEDIRRNAERVYTQNMLLAQKRRESARIVYVVSTSAGISGTITSLSLVPHLIVMINKINNIYGISINQTALKSLLTTVLCLCGVPVTGHILATKILRLVPVLGSMTSAASANLLTKSIGIAYIRICEAAFQGDLNEEDIVSDKGIALLATELKRNMDGYK